ncbi:50S ribosomal protein L25 [Patescibacteria group bacterium]
MKMQNLKSEERTILGRKVKNLRKEGKIPATVYGKGFQSVSITVNENEFSNVYNETGETGLIQVDVGKNKHPVLVGNVQTHPVSDKVLHIEFHKVDLKEKVKANVPIEIIGTAEAVENKLGLLLTITNEIEVEALPTELPDSIQVDVTKLSEVNQDIKVSDLNLPKGAETLLDKNTPIVKIAPLVVKEEVEEVKEEEGVDEEGQDKEGAEEEAVDEKSDESNKKDEAKTGDVKKDDAKRSDKKEEEKGDKPNKN